MTPRQRLLLFFSLGVLSVVAIWDVDLSSTRQSCCTETHSPTWNGGPVGTSYHFDFGGIGSGPQQEAFISRFDDGALRWNNEFAARNESQRVTKVGSGGVWTVFAVTGLNDAEADCGVMKIFIPAGYITGSSGYSADEIIAFMQHEIGDAVGYGHPAGSCDTSVMSAWAGQDKDFSWCDHETWLLTDLGQYWTDNDADGYSPNEYEYDCNDGDRDQYPGAPLDCYGNPGGDMNCNGVEDFHDCNPSPIVVDIGGNGFRLTDAAGGVTFDLNGDGRSERLPWTDPEGDDAWLALDRNGNGLVDDGAELFGNFTEQPASQAPNGFEALRVFDEVGKGGNRDGWIDTTDDVFGSLRLWRDGNQDGMSQASELHGVAWAHLRRISLDYREFRRVDQWGNWFRYGARILDDRNRDIGPWAFDVFLGSEPPPPPRLYGWQGGRRQGQGQPDLGPRRGRSGR
jgi:hypothetical protein